MKRALLFLALLLIAPRLHAMGSATGFCEAGNQLVRTSGLNSITKVQASYPACTITVYVSGTVTLASIYSDNGVTPLANPFTANADGTWTFFADNGTYDVVKSGAGIPTALTVHGITTFDPAVATGQVRDCSAPKYGSPANSASVRIHNCILDLPVGVGGVADARGLNGTQTIDSDMFSGISSPVLLLLGAGTYTWTATNTITNPYTAINGLGVFFTTINCTVNGDCLRITSNPWVSPNQAGLSGGFTLNGSSGANAVGIHASGIVGYSLMNVVFQNFTGTNSAGLWLDHGASFSDPTANFVERFGASMVDFEFNTIGLKLTAQAAATSKTFDFMKFMDLRYHVDAGQTGVLLDGTNAGSMISSMFQSSLNCVSGGTMLKLTNGAISYDSNIFAVEGETTSGAPCIGVDLDAGSKLLGVGVIDVKNGGTTANISPNAVLAVRVGRNEPGSGYSLNFLETDNTFAVRSPVIVGGYGTYIHKDLGAAGSFRQGLGNNAYFNGTNWTALGNGATNHGAALLFDGDRYSLIVTPTTGGSNQTIASSTFYGSDKFSCNNSGCSIGSTLASAANLSIALTASNSINFGTVSANSCNDVAFALAGALSTDSYFVTTTAVPTTGILLNVYGASASAPTVRACNVTVNPIVLGSITVRVDAWRH